MPEKFSGEIGKPGPLDQETLDRIKRMQEEAEKRGPNETGAFANWVVDEKGQLTNRLPANPETTARPRRAGRRGPNRGNAGGIRGKGNKWMDASHPETRERKY
jgi:hypothetical protein